VTQTTRGSCDLVLNDSLALLHEAGARVRNLRAPVQRSGEVHGCFISGGGVPKIPVDELVVSATGAVGDTQKTRKHHGRPWQALCLWSSDVVGDLAKDGHPIKPGFAGENISIAGLDWAEVRPGSQLRIGAVLIETSLYALPCAKNAAWFTNRDFERMHHRRETGVSRIYASVLEPGTIRPGDSVTLNP
jgi:MOSC domain-containing protein YiiM